MILADQQVPDDATVTPGAAGFLVFAALAVIVILLVLSMSRHLRKIDARAAQMEADAADERAAAETAGGGPEAQASADTPADHPGGAAPDARPREE